MNLKLSWQVFVKELVDALRDRKTLSMVLLSSVALGPLMLVLLSVLVSGIEKQAENTSVSVVGLGAAPTLENYLARQGVTVVAMEEPLEPLREAVAAQSQTQAVLLVPSEFEAQRARAEVPTLEILFNSSNTKSSASAAALSRLLRGFNAEQGALRLAMRGLSPASLEALDVQERDLAPMDARSSRMAGLVPFFLLMALVYGALGAALDSTAGERERGSLEPLLMTPVPHSAVVLGKWAAVAALAMLIAVLGCLSFLPGQWLLRSETLAAAFRFGWLEALQFIGLLLPLAGAVAAVLMAVAIRSKSFKEAQAGATIVVLAISLLPVVTMLDTRTQAFWQLLVPALAQITLMRRVLEGLPMPAVDLLVPAAVCVVIVVGCLAWVARGLRQAALK